MHHHEEIFHVSISLVSRALPKPTQNESLLHKILHILLVYVYSNVYF